MAASPMAVVEQSLEERVEVIIEDYVLDLGRRFAAEHGESGPGLHREKLQDDLGRIRKRLGGERYQRVSDLMAAAFAVQDESGDPALHGEWITVLLEEYYDPMYAYQLDQRAGEAVFRGSRDEVVAWAVGDA
jgi:tRNA 2-selenouridine synthase